MHKKKIKRFFVLTLLFMTILGRSQNLPLEFRISENDHRLIRGNNNFPGFYDLGSVDTIYLNFSQSNFWDLLTANYESKTDIAATLKYKGKAYENVGVRFKGMTSYKRLDNSDKKSFNISMDYLNDQDIDGYTTFNLNNAYEDESAMREFLYFYFNRKHIPSAKANFVILMINGSSWGVYTNVQQLNKQHAREWFGDADATRWRAEGEDSGFGAPGGGGPGGDGGGGFGAGSSTLNYLGGDTTTYQEFYTLKNAYKDDPWTDLVTACKVLNTVDENLLVDSLNKVMDVDGALWFLAQEILFTDDDSYVNKGGMDYCVYFDVGTNRLVPIEYDGNSSFLMQDASSWSPFYKQENTDFPLMNILFSVPELRQRYLAHVRTILNESLNSESTDAIIDKYAALIDGHVYDDPKKIYTYSQFKSGITGLKDFVSARNAYLKSNTEINVSPPEISSVIFGSGNGDFSTPGSSDTVHVTANVTGNSGISAVYLYFGTGIEGRFVKNLMYDDGVHGDGEANDNVYGISIPPYEKSTYVRFYIEAVDNSTSKTRSYVPAGAEHDVFVYRVKTAESVYSDVVINEIMPSNPYFNDQDGEKDDWIELFNNSNSIVDLTGYYLTDNDGKLTKWKFPDGTAIGPGGYLMVWADKDTLQEGLHTNFKLSKNGEELLLVTPGILIADQVIYSEQNSALAYARMKNGTGPFTWQYPTFNSENIEITAGTPTLAASYDMIIYPNPASGVVNIEAIGLTTGKTLSIYNIYGEIVYNKEFNGFASVDVSGYSNGIYLIALERNVYKRLVIAH